MNTHGMIPENPSSAGVRTIAYPSPPNPNGDLHLGHLSGPVLSADVYIRHRRLLGDPAYFVVGTDDNQIWTTAMAEQRGETPQQTADLFAERIAGTLEKVQVDCAHLYRPNASPYHADLVRDTVRRLYDRGHLVAEEAPALVCEHCDDLYLFEVRVTGTCPHCGEGTCGNACEDCGLPNQVVDMIDPVCKQCGNTPTEKPVRRLFFPLEPYREMLVEYHRQTAMSTQHRALCHRLMAGELPRVVSSHISDWGIPVPLPGFDGQVVSAWLEMAPGYLAASAELSDKIGRDDGWQAFWGSGNNRVVQFFGFDNCWNHGVLYPALLHAFDETVRPPVAFVSNQLYRLDYSKFSTSRDHAVWTRDLVAKNSADTVRFYVAFTAPEVERSNFSLAEFADFVSDELIGRWQPWLASVQTRVDAGCAGLAPEGLAWTANQQSYRDRLGEFLAGARADYAPESFSLQRAARRVMRLVHEAQAFGVAEAAWADLPSATSQNQAGIALELATIRVLALISAPLMPEFSERLWRALGYSSAVGGWDDEPQLVPPDQAVSGLAAEFFPPPVVS